MEEKKDDLMIQKRYSPEPFGILTRGGKWYPGNPNPVSELFSNFFFIYFHILSILLYLPFLFTVPPA
jgi:hypothetical protein